MCDTRHVPCPAAAPTAAAGRGSPAGRAADGAPAAPLNQAGLQIPDVEAGKFNVGAILIGPHDDGGWSQAHYDGLTYLEKNVPNTHVAYVENVPEGAEAEQAIRALARKGFNLIFTTSFGFMDPTAAVAEEFPDTTFIHVVGLQDQQQELRQPVRRHGRHEVPGRHGRGFAGQDRREHEARLHRHLPDPRRTAPGQRLRAGHEEDLPRLHLDVRWINTWHDPVVEKEAAASLFDAGAQVVFTGADTPAPADVAQAKGKWGITYDWVGSCKVERCLTTIYWDWGKIYSKIAQGVIDKTYKPGFDYFDADSGALGLFGFMEGQQPTKGMQDLPAEDMQMVKDTLAKMLKGEFTRFDVFAGPIKDNKGNVVVPAGEKMVQADLDQFPPGAPGLECKYCMYWWADGVTAELPKQ